MWSFYDCYYNIGMGGCTVLKFQCYDYCKAKYHDYCFIRVCIENWWQGPIIMVFHNHLLITIIVSIVRHWLLPGLVNCHPYYISDSQKMITLLIPLVHAYVFGYSSRAQIRTCVSWRHLSSVPYITSICHTCSQHRWSLLCHQLQGVYLQLKLLVVGGSWDQEHRNKLPFVVCIIYVVELAM